MNEREINDLAKTIIDKLKAEQLTAEPEPVPRKLFIIFGEAWSNLHYVMFDELKQLPAYDRIAVVPSAWLTGKEIAAVRQFDDWAGIISREEAAKEMPQGIDAVTVFAKADRELIAKTALGIEDIFAAKWIRKALEQGQRIALLKSGLDRFTGKEPEAYRKTILNYHRTLLEYQIELLESILDLAKERVGR